jgi:hypothetical protein
MGRRGDERWEGGGMRDGEGDERWGGEMRDGKEGG